MLQFIKELFRGESLLDQAFDETNEILNVARDMIRTASDSLRKSDQHDPVLDVYMTDKSINKYERETRRKVLTHMAVSSAADFTPALVLTSIVIDVERIGDYAKNIVELAEAHTRALHAGEYEERLQDLENRVWRGFDGVGGALRESNEDFAREFMVQHMEYARLADQIVEDLIKNEDSLTKGDAVALALYVRYLKRVESHLTNIVSSVVNPFPRIGFRDKRK